MRNAARLVSLAAFVAASISCGDVARSGSSPVYLVIDQLQGIRGGPNAGQPSGTLVSDVITNVTSPAPCSTDSPCATIFGDSGQVSLRAPLKDIGSGAPLLPTTNNEVTINRYHVEYIRADGRNTPGVDVPFAFDGAATGTIPAGGTLNLGFELVRNIAKREAPLVQLRRDTNITTNIITTIARVTFYGQDRTGNAVSVTGQIQVNFGDFGD
jgi:hypothetical protein